MFNGLTGVGAAPRIFRLTLGAILYCSDSRLARLEECLNDDSIARLLDLSELITEKGKEALFIPSIQCDKSLLHPILPCIDRHFYDIKVVDYLPRTRVVDETEIEGTNLQVKDPTEPIRCDGFQFQILHLELAHGRT